MRMNFGHVLLISHGLGPCYDMVNNIYGKVGWVSMVKSLVNCKYYFDCEMRDGFWACGIDEPSYWPMVWYG